MKLFNYKVYGLDVWGNADDGYEVNDRYSVGEISLTEDFSDALLIEELITSELLIKNNVAEYVKRCEIDSCSDDYITINCEGKPLFDLELQSVTEEGE